MSVFPYTGERAVPWNMATGGHIMHPHIMRYAWASQFVTGRQVVDLGCGVGYGAYLLSWMAATVQGVDKDPEAIEYAMSTFRADNLRYIEWLVEWALPTADVYTAFELLEHLDDPKQLLDRIGKPLVWSIPVNDGSQFHKRAYAIGEIETMMKRSQFYYQSREGQIAPKENAWFMPVYILGVRA